MKKTTNQQQIYHAFALFYDRLMSEKKYLKWNELIKNIVQKYIIPKGICLDIACGTGRISKLLIDQGFRVIGIDISKDILEIAKKNFPEVSFIKADIRNFDIENRDQIVMAVSFYDSLNYLLTDEDMTAMFKSVARNLSSNAIFLFDMNTRDHIRISQQNKPRVYRDKDSYIVFHFGGKDRIWTLDIDIFAKQADGSYNLCQEQHIERGYDKKDIIPLLRKAGLTLLEVIEEEKEYEDGKKHLSRLYFVVRK